MGNNTIWFVREHESALMLPTLSAFNGVAQGSTPSTVGADRRYVDGSRAYAPTAKFFGAITGSALERPPG